jgi:hypothetical protein
MMLSFEDSTIRRMRGSRRTVLSGLPREVRQRRKKSLAYRGR